MPLTEAHLLDAIRTAMLECALEAAEQGVDARPQLRSLTSLAQPEILTSLLREFNEEDASLSITDAVGLVHDDLGQFTGHSTHPHHPEVKSRLRKILHGAASLPSQVHARAVSFAKKKYRTFEARYGRKGAIALMSATVLLAPIPVPGTAFLPVAVAEGYLAARKLMRRRPAAASAPLSAHLAITPSPKPKPPYSLKTPHGPAVDALTRMHQAISGLKAGQPLDPHEVARRVHAQLARDHAEIGRFSGFTRIPPHPEAIAGGIQHAAADSSWRPHTVLHRLTRPDDADEQISLDIHHASDVDPADVLAAHGHLPDSFVRQMSAHAIGRLRDLHSASLRSLPREQLQALQAYTQKHYRTVNVMLEDPSKMSAWTRAQLEPFVEAIDAAHAAHGKLPTPEHVWRGIHISDPEEYRRLMHGLESSMRTGEPLRMNRYQSATLDPLRADNYSVAPGESPLIMEILAHRGLYLPPISGHPSEQEVLLPRHVPGTSDGQYFVRNIRDVPVKGYNRDSGPASKTSRMIQLEQLP